MPYRITKTQFYAGGGLGNPKQFRRMVGGYWTYYNIGN